MLTLNTSSLTDCDNDPYNCLKPISEDVNVKCQVGVTENKLVNVLESWLADVEPGAETNIPFLSLCQFSSVKY